MRSAVLVLLLTLPMARARAQVEWRAGPDVELIRSAVAHRAERDADTLLAVWHATAHGVVRFASEVHHESGPIERVIRADELRVEVYGEAPNRSKQIIVAWRDTSFLPNRLNYHRDHLGIIANDFGGVIRLGEGDEVRDVIHPLSPAGVGQYQYAIGDTLTLAGAQGRIRVVAVQVRPIDAASAAAVGTLYLDIDRAALVRFRFTFTPAAYRDPTVEGITVTLENTLQENTHWLPWRQSMVIRRGTPWIDLPLRTVLRADWTLADYSLGASRPADQFSGAAVTGLRRPDAGARWDAPLVAQLDLLPATDADVAAVTADAARALGAHLLDGLPGLRLLATGASDVVHVNRVQGVVPQLGTRLVLGRGLTLRAQLGIGTADHRVVGRWVLDRPFGGVQGSLQAERSVADIGSPPVISGTLNSLRTAFAGDDRGDYLLLERVQLGVMLPAGAAQLALTAGAEWSGSVASAFTPLTGTSAPNAALGIGGAAVVRGILTRRGSDGNGWNISAEGGAGAREWLRLSLAASTAVALGSGVLQLEAMGGAGTHDLPAYRSFVLGGRATLPGIPYRALGGRRAGLLRAGWALPINFPTPPVPTLGRLPVPSAVGPFVAAGVAGGSVAAPWQATGRIETVAGVRIDLWGPLLRFEGGASLRTGRLGLTLDVHPDWWPVM